MERIVLLVILIVFGAFFVPSIWRRVEIFRLSRKVRNRNLVLGFNVYIGGDDYLNPDAAIAIQRMRDQMRSLGVKIGDLHPEAADDLRIGKTWRYSRIAETNIGKADLVFVGDWRIWRQMHYSSGPLDRYSLHASLYRNNGWKVKQRRNMELSLLKIRPMWLTRHLLAEQILLVVLRGLTSTLNGPAPDPGFYYDTSEWPYSEVFSSNIV